MNCPKCGANNPKKGLCKRCSRERDTETKKFCPRCEEFADEKHPCFNQTEIGTGVFEQGRRVGKRELADWLKKWCKENYFDILNKKVEDGDLILKKDLLSAVEKEAKK